MSDVDVKEAYIKINNGITEPRNSIHLTPNELFLYAYLCVEKNMVNRLHTSYDLLKHTVKLTNNRRVSENKKIVMDCISSLRSRGLITVSNISSDVIDVEILDNKEGYEKVSFEDFYRLNDPRDFLIYVAVKKWSRMSFGAIYSYEQWGEILGISRSRAISIIQDAVSRGIIKRKANAYSRDDQIRKDGSRIVSANNYFVNDGEDEDLVEQ